MKILINAFSAKDGGGQIYLKYLLQNIPKTAEVRIFTSIKFLEEKENLKVIFIKINQNPFIRFLFEFFFIPFYILKKKYDIYFCPGGYIPNFTFGKKIKTVTMFRNIIPMMNNHSCFPLNYIDFRNYILKFLMRISYKNSHLTIFVSKFARDLIKKKYLVKNSIVIYHGLEEKFVNKNLNFNSDHFYNSKIILYVSNTHDYKNHIQLIKSFNEFDLDRRRKYKLVFVGEKIEPTFSHLKKIIESYNLEKNVEFLGKVNHDQLPEIYSKSWVNVFPSKYENCPNTLIEMLGSGRPVITSDIPPMNELVANSSLFCNFNIISEFSEKIKFLEIKTNYEKYSKFALEQSSYFNWQKCSNITWKKIFDLKNAE